MPRSPSPRAGATLASLRKGDAATIIEVGPNAGSAESEHVRRLHDLGFFPGERVRVTATGFPYGDPIAVRIGRATFALRRFEAELIRVAPAGKGSD